MAMTKHEQAEMEELRIRLALAWPEYPVPQAVSFATGIGSNHLRSGWFMNAYNGEISEGCSTGVFHSRRSTTKTDSQNAGKMYDSKLDALKAMRHEMTREFAEKLRKVDQKIEAENGTPND